MNTKYDEIYEKLNVTLPHGHVYEGDFVNGRPHGKGKLIWANGHIFNGDFVNGKPCGKGTMRWANGNVFEGYFIDATPHGKGKMIYHDGRVQEGNWQNGVYYYLKPMEHYSEFVLSEKLDEEVGGYENRGCPKCGLSRRYSDRFAKTNSGLCAFCETFVEPVFLGEQALIRDIDLQTGEKVGITVSGGKDSLFAWKRLVDIFGKERVVAFSHVKVGIVHPIALRNLKMAQEILGTELVLVNDNEMLPRFRKNFAALIKNPSPEMIRVAICAGCRYGITRALYVEGQKMGINKYLSAASYLELAPFKEDLLKEGNSDSTLYGVIRGLAGNDAYCFDDNLNIIIREDSFRYKGNTSIADGYSLFDFDHYFPNDPQKTEYAVQNDLKWERPERSWHFDCQLETFKDVFYYGILGYTETDFKLSAMVRHGLLSREDAMIQLHLFNRRLRESYNDTAVLMDKLGIGEYKAQMLAFYESSKFFSEKIRYA
jgi:hypothetical protein